MSTRYQFLAQAKRSLLFLASLGFSAESEHEGTYSSIKDGFEISDVSKEVLVRVSYYDMVFEIVFTKGRIAASYHLRSGKQRVFDEDA